MKVENARAVETYIEALINWRWNDTSVGNSKYEPKMIWKQQLFSEILMDEYSFHMEQQH